MRLKVYFLFLLSAQVVEHYELTCSSIRREEKVALNKRDHFDPKEPMFI